VDILPPDTSDLSPYKLVLAPGILALSDALKSALKTYKGTAIIGPRSNSKTPELTIPDPLPPNLPGLDLTVTRSETFRADMDRPLQNGGAIRHWVDHVETTETVTERTTTGDPVLIGDGPLRYLTAWLDETALARILTTLCAEQNIETHPLQNGLRLRRTDSHVFAFNYGLEPATFQGHTIPPAGVYWAPK